MFYIHRGAKNEYLCTSVVICIISYQQLYIDEYDWLRNDPRRLSTNENRSNIRCVTMIARHYRTEAISNLDLFCFYCQNKGIYDQLLDVICIQW